MNTKFRRVARRAATICLCLGLATGSLTALSACSPELTPIATLGEHEISVNMYKFILSRIKGNLGRAGYSVDSADFWNTIVDSDNTTYDGFFRQTALADTRRYLAALELFEKEELKLPKSEYDKIDKEIADLIASAGSKSALNAELSAFGVNIDILRDIYVIEAKFNHVRDHICGKDGSLIAAQVRQEYLEKNAVAFRHVLIRSFDYVYETDANGDDIYFLPDENNAKVDNIAYDKENGNVRLDEYDELIKDANGDTVYYLESGHIAYDKENGVRARVYDKEGIAVTEKLSSEEMAKNKAVAEEILATVEAGDYVAFEALLAEYELDEDDYFDTNVELSFLYTVGDNGSDYLNDIAEALSLIEVGELRNVYTSEYGYNVVMRYPMPSDAASNSEYEEWFTGLADRVVSEQFHKMCQPYMDKVKIDEKAFSELPSMTEIGANYYY